MNGGNPPGNPAPSAAPVHPRNRVRRSRPDLTPEVIRRRVFAFLSRRGYDEETARHAVETAADEYLGRP